jgi:polysaccharide transporter, PST family
MQASGMNAVLLRNFAALSIVQAASYVLPLISVPYLVRTLGADRFGAIAFAQAFVQYFAILTDYGFGFSATRAVSVSREAPQRIAGIYWNVCLIKLGLMTGGFIVMAALLVIVPVFRADWSLYCVSYLSVLGSALFPIWLFQGLESMAVVAVLTVGARMLCLAGIFLLVKRPDDYLIAAGLQAGAMPIAGIIATWLLFTTMQIPLRRVGLPGRKELLATLADGWEIFLSMTAISLYTGSNIFVLGLIETKTAVGYYAMADKLIRAAIGLMQPLSQALYPRMSYLFSRDVSGALQRLKAVAVPASLAGLALTLVLLETAGLVVRILYGDAAAPAADVLRIMAFVPLMVLLSNLLGVQMLFHLGRQRPVSRFQIATGVVSCAALVPMIGYWGVAGCAVNYLLSETAIVVGFALIATKALKEARHAPAHG